MKWMIIVLIMMSLVGSMMWVMPSKRQRYQAELRAKAKTHGFQVQLERITAPRASGEMEAEARTMTAYRLLRSSLSAAEKNSFIPWQIYRVKAVANRGLPDQWSWGSGEGKLTDQQLEHLNQLIEKLPEGVFAIHSTPVHLSVHWNEGGGEGTLLEIKQALESVMEKGI